MPIKHAGILLEKEDYQNIKMYYGTSNVITVFLNDGVALMECFNDKESAQDKAKALLDYKMGIVF